MLTLEQAIASYEKSAERYHRSFLRCKAHGGEFYQEGAESNKICYEHYCQLSEWLRELQERRKRPEQRWIPCSERLPENGRQVLVYAMSTHFALAKYDEMREADGSYIKQWVTFDAWKPFYRVKDVIAWMELPEPYKMGRNE